MMTNMNNIAILLIPDNSIVTYSYDAVRARNEQEARIQRLGMSCAVHMMMIWMGILLLLILLLLNNKSLSLIFNLLSFN